jgi:DNA-binding transcriptional LysR family regulator
MGVLLFHRSTRRVTTTRAGIALFDRVQPWLSRLEQSLRDLPDTAPTPAGTLRVTVSADLGTAVLAEPVARYATRYPDTRVKVQLSPRTVDLAKEGFDLAIRYTRGTQQPGAALVTRKLGAVAFALYAAPDYLARRGLPKSTADLSEHDLVMLGAAKGELPGRPRVVTDDKLFARAVVRAGGGIGLLPTYLTGDDLSNGTLVRVVSDFVIATGAVYLVMPSNKHMPSKVAAFRDLLLEHFRQHPLHSR